MTGTVQAWNIAAGQFFFKHRNNLFPFVFAVSGLIMRPRALFSNPRLDQLMMGAGAVIAVLGELLRLATIGFDYIDRGGKNKQVYASRLVAGGIYAHTRNPMYAGNALIAIGMSLVTGAPFAYVVIVPFFLFVYQAIVCAEEAYLRSRFGREYEEYCARVNRFIPSLRGASRSFSGMRYDWKRALRQDLSTIAGLLMGLALVPLWRTYFLNGWDAAKAAAPQAIIGAIGVGAFFGVVYTLKKQGKLA